MSRGSITIEVKAVAKEALGIEDISRQELRLMPYVHYVAMNSQCIDPLRINQEERDILSRWREKGWLRGGAGGMTVSKHFWDGLCKILWIAYVVQPGGAHE